MTKYYQLHLYSHVAFSRVGSRNTEDAAWGVVNRAGHAERVSMVRVSGRIGERTT